MRLLSFSVFIMLTLSLAFPPQLHAKAPAGNPRYAALIMDEQTGAILHQENAYAKRYPASLTKMMTLYMLFEALNKGKLSMRTEMVASKYAAGMPQTNLSLRPGSKITVEQAIKALVIRSANDVAVVVAEKVGGSVPNFAAMATAKARQLGMKNTVFRNPHGLPDPAQYTTAYDMALLGKALKRDYPQYYAYFNTRSFSYNGVTYTTHNNVLNRYSGTDGIKTGFIRASGFNLVTSVNKHGRKLVGVVMGGFTARSRDDQMISLLNRTYAQLNDKTFRERAFASATTPSVAVAGVAAPLPMTKPVISKPADIELAAAKPAPPRFMPQVVPVAKPVAKPTSNVAPAFIARDEKKPAPSASIALNDVSPAAPAPAVSVNYTPVSYQPPVATAPARNTLEYQLAAMQGGRAESDTLSARLPSSASGAGKDWGIQVGAFNNEQQAKEAVKKAFTLAHDNLRDAYITISEQKTSNQTVHRARLGNLSRDEAAAACAKLKAQQSSCFALPIQ